MYVVDLYDGQLLNKDNLRLNSYNNAHWFSKLIQGLELFESQCVSIVHVHGHTLDFGNMEADFAVNFVMREYRVWSNIINSVS